MTSSPGSLISFAEVSDDCVCCIGEELNYQFGVSPVY